MFPDMDKGRKEIEDHDSIASGHPPLTRNTREIQPSGLSDSICAILRLNGRERRSKEEGGQRTIGPLEGPNRRVGSP